MRKTICLIDRNRSFLEAMRGIFENFGFGVIVSSRVDQALPSVVGGGVNLVVSDVCLPGMSGLDLLEKLREYNSKVPVVFLAEWATNEIVEYARSRGAAGFFLKPIPLLEVISFARRLLNDETDREHAAEAPRFAGNFNRGAA